MSASQKIALALLLVCFIVCSVSCESTDVSDVAEGRTFSHHFLKRMSFAVVPGAFIIGVITTLLAALTVVSMKGLGVGVILLVLAISQVLSRSLTPVHAAVHAAPLAAPAPVPIVYSHAHTQQPVWLEKEW